MGPPLQVPVALMLELVLPPLVKFHHHVSDVIRHALIPDIVDHRLLEFIGENGKWFRLRWRRNLLKKVVSESVLNAGIFKEDGLRPYVENTVVTLDYNHTIGQSTGCSENNE